MSSQTVPLSGERIVVVDVLGKVGAAVAVGMAIGFFMVQILFASAWLARFSLGPVEWLWRSLTYFTLRPQARRAAGIA